MEHGLQAIETSSTHNRLDKLLWNSRYEATSQNIGRVDKAKDKDVLLEAVEEDKNQA